MMKQPGETGASKLVIGWIEPGGTKRDAIDYAKGYAQRHFDAPEASWYAVMPFMDGWLYEVQENGSGKSYLPGVAKALASGSEESWIRVGIRAMSVGLREGRPYCVVMSEADSRLMEGDGQRLTASGRMTRVIQKGSGVMYTGLAIAISGFAFFAGAAAFHVIRDQNPPSLRQVNLDLLPHQQWERVGNVPINLFVERLELLSGEDRWQTTVKPIQRSSSSSTATPVSPIEEVSQEISNDVVDEVFVEPPVMDEMSGEQPEVLPPVIP